MDRGQIDRIIEIAAEIFAEHGNGGVGMRELSSRCGAGTPTLYRYFGSKEYSSSGKSARRDIGAHWTQFSGSSSD